MAKRNLLLCFDAFGTLFHIKRPIEQQYGAVARQYGLSGFSDDQLRDSFRLAFRAESKSHPNYGKQNGMGATRWWSNVIHGTFKPFLPSTATELPPGLVPHLLRQFASSEGYSAAPRLGAVLSTLRQQPGARPNSVYDRVVIGVITNSDDRVPGVLSALGLHVSPLRFSEKMGHGCDANVAITGTDSYDIDFHCMSYDVGFEKPDTRIFQAAEGLLMHVLSGNKCLDGSIEKKDEANTCIAESWDKMYVGDDYNKDVVGAQYAGWYPVFLAGIDKQKQDDPTSIQRLDTLRPQSLASLYKQYPIVQIHSLDVLVDWLTGHCVER
ncbi:HAD-like domain protein [Niveomyces insectorum RCEF 264]|uniref:HAD-like domain protein n=1 Tax=Niveomyces insectorum RCEF 264 TaxID=1081102 RepID=A0A167ZRH4_9HYPO|nr:HAD-like domain protein [Niveomyces insectorum RCEF 264]